MVLLKFHLNRKQHQKSFSSFKKVLFVFIQSQFIQVKNMKTANKLLLLINGLFFSSLAFSYLKSSSENQFPIFENLFQNELSKKCTENFCFLSLSPFLGVLYGSCGLLCILGFLFYKDLMSINIGLLMASGVHLGMGVVRGTLAPKSLYDEKSMYNVNIVNLGTGGLILIFVLLSLVFGAKKDEKKKNE